MIRLFHDICGMWWLELCWKYIYVGLWSEDLVYPFSILTKTVGQMAR